MAQASTRRQVAARFAGPAVALALVLGSVACGGDDEDAVADSSAVPADAATSTTPEEGPDDTSATDATDTTADAPDTSDPTDPSETTAPATTGPVLRLDGIGDLDFGTSSMDVAVQQISDVLGPEDGVVVNDECPAGPTQIVDFGGLQILGMDGALEGWSYRDTDPGSSTAEGITVGSSAADLLAAHPTGSIEETSLGHEFQVEEAGRYMGALLDGPDGSVEILFAGLTCAFR